MNSSFIKCQSSKSFEYDQLFKSIFIQCLQYTTYIPYNIDAVFNIVCYICLCIKQLVTQCVYIYIHTHIYLYTHNFTYVIYMHMGFSGYSEMPAMQETWVQSLGWEDSLQKEWLPTPYSCLGNSMDKGAWQATVPGITTSQAWLSDFHTHAYAYTFYLVCTQYVH